MRSSNLLPLGEFEVSPRSNSESRSSHLQVGPGRHRRHPHDTRDRLHQSEEQPSQASRHRPPVVSHLRSTLSSDPSLSPLSASGLSASRARGRGRTMAAAAVASGSARPVGASPRVGLLYDDRMCAHATPDGEDHPENPERLRAIWCKLAAEGVASRYAPPTTS